MNRQARVVDVIDGEVYQVGFDNWQSYGNVKFFEAVRKHALNQTADHVRSAWFNIQVRDEHDPSIPPAVFCVEVTREARILNPRRDADKHEKAPTLSGVWRRIKEAFPW